MRILKAKSYISCKVATRVLSTCKVSRYWCLPLHGITGVERKCNSAENYNIQCDSAIVIHNDWRIPGNSYNQTALWTRAALSCRLSTFLFSRIKRAHVGGSTCMQIVAGRKTHRFLTAVPVDCARKPYFIRNINSMHMIVHGGAPCYLREFWYG